MADVLAPTLYTRLLDPADVPDRVTRALRTFELDPGTVKVDWALDGGVPWTGAPDLAPGTVHVADSVADMSQAMSQVQSGAVPAAPFMLTGQMTTSDPSRSPAGTESFWAYAHVPQRASSDAGDGGIRGTWDRDDCERFADRMQARLERAAPGFGDRVLARRVLGPHEMEARDANLVGGALNGGTAQLHQQLVFRPVPGLGRAETPVRGLYLGSASAHPGGGVHGACGDNAARAAIARDRVERVIPGRGRGAPGSLSGQRSSAGPAASRTGPRADCGSSTRFPPCWTSTTSCPCSSRATSRATGMRSRHCSPPTTRAASLGQMVLVSRCLSSARTVAARRSRSPSSEGSSHQGSPRSPRATLASCTNGRAASPRLPTRRRARMSSLTSSARSGSGMEVSVARQRRPSTTMWWPSGVRSTSSPLMSTP